MFHYEWGKFPDLFQRSKVFIKWMGLAIMTGGIVGVIASLFYYCMAYVTGFRSAHSFMIYLLPIGGILIIAFYHLLGVYKVKGTNLVIGSIRSNEAIPFKMAPLIFISTVITHLFGGSAGREGAALQLGGSLAAQIGKVIHLEKNDIHILTMAGMSAAFTALFGTPITAAIFSMEVISVGVMYYVALVPCAFASITAYLVAQAFNIAPEKFTILNIPDLSIKSLIIITILGILCAVLSSVFCTLLHQVSHWFTHTFKNAYIKVLVGACLLIGLFTIFGQDYAGAGMNIIERSLEGEVKAEAFLLKMIFTAITLGCGFKGGEIVPSFFVGATFGCLFGQICHFSPSLCAALGLVALFCGVTNCPLTSLLLSFELFGFTGIYYFLIVDAISYMLSGYIGLYKEQKIIYSKYSPVYIDKKASDEE